MKTIGIRAAPRTVTFAIFDTKNVEVLNVEKIKIPAAFDAPEALKYLRSNLLDVLREYEIDHAGIRITEASAKTMNIPRIQIEGVIQESFASSQLKSYYIGQIASISKRLGIDRTRFKPIVSGENDLQIDNWDKMKTEEREAILCAMGAKHA